MENFKIVIYNDSKKKNAPENKLNLFWDKFIDSIRILDSSPVIDSHLKSVDKLLDIMFSKMWKYLNTI